MVLDAKNTTLAYRCPKCGAAVMSGVNMFSLTADMLKLKCSCGGSELVLVNGKDAKVRLTVPCMLCGGGHHFTLSRSLFFGKELFCMPCPYTDINLCCVGEENHVKAEMSRSELELLRLLEENGLTDRSFMSVESIIDFADSVDVEDVAPVLERQIEYNMAIAEEGLAKPYGANIGKTLLKNHGADLSYKMRAYAAAASDARMNGCEKPVIINSGSGNQGITTSVPVVVYAREKGLTREELLRGLCVANLVTAHLKTGIGRLSAYCGAVSAGCGAAAGICYLQGGRFHAIAHTVVNALAMDSGIICDGAKASCAAKISSAIDAGLLGLEMYHSGDQFYGGDGLVKKGVENTIATIGRLARQGMGPTDKEIIRLMME
jgi:L-cysteine desulfidase